MSCASSWRSPASVTSSPSSRTIPASPTTPTTPPDHRRLTNDGAAPAGRRHHSRAWVSGHLGAGRAQLLAGLDDASGHAGLGQLAPGAGVVGLLVADVAVDLQHAVVVLEHVLDDGAGEGVLGVGVDVDRKSTRLNSSHVAISYAVFCLKKKTFIF